MKFFEYVGTAILGFAVIYYAGDRFGGFGYVGGILAVYAFIRWRWYMETK